LIPRPRGSIAPVIHREGFPPPCHHARRRLAGPGKRVPSLLRFQLLVGSWSSNSQKDQNGAIQPHHILVSKRPTCSPIFVLGTVVTLSTIKRQTVRSPLLSLGLMRSRKRGASVGSVVNAHTVMESVMSKRSSWRITTGRGFPA